MESTVQSYFWPFVIASFGGAFVAIFISLEIISEKKWYANTNSMHRWERVKKWAAWFVVGGIAIEVIVGGCAAINEKKSENSIAYMQRVRFDEPNLREILSRFRKDNGICPVKVVIISSFENESLKASRSLVGHFAAEWGGVEGPEPAIVLSDGVEIDSAMEQKSGNDESQAAAFFLLQALTDEREVAFMMPGDNKIPENVIVIKVGPKPREAAVQTDINKAKFFINMFKNSKNPNIRNEYQIDRYSEVVKVKARSTKIPN